MTYSKSLGQPVIAWDSILKQLIEDHSLIEELWQPNLDRAASYLTCPCGQLSKYIPRDRVGIGPTHAPLDDTLKDLGGSFFIEFRSKNFESALDVFNLIQIRAAFVLDKSIKVIKANLTDKVAELENTIAEKTTELERVRVELAELK